MKATCIEWDVDNEEDLKFLLTEIDIPDELKEKAENEEKYIEMVSDYLSDVTGYCHKGFVLE